MTGRDILSKEEEDFIAISSPRNANPSASHVLLNMASSVILGRGNGIARRRLLADKEHIYGAEIEVIIKGKRSKTFVRWVLAGIKLERAQWSAQFVGSCKKTTRVC